MRIRIRERGLVYGVHKLLKKHVVRRQQPQFWREHVFCNRVAKAPAAECEEYCAAVNFPETFEDVDVVGAG
jgi:hypothetical protein